MLFHTVTFGLLLVGTLAAFYLLPRRWRLFVLAISSLMFYAAAGLVDFGVLLAILVVTYRLSLRIRPSGPKWPIAVALLLALGSLAYFKYAAFIYVNINIVLSSVDLPSLPRFGGFVLPLGISFYTFQIVAYLVDLHKGRTEPTRHLFRYLVFITFFGQLIAGPIMRASEYLNQLSDLPGANSDDFRTGTLLILLGLVKKVVIGDSLARLVDARFASFETLSQAEVWVAAYLFAFQIFFDFSGYVSIALGLGLIFGIKLQENFRTPYLSRGPSEFWGRWHTTLSRWFRDYLYIPLGGNRKGRARELANLMTVMCLVGLWHGAGWTFIFWGAIHGGLLWVSRFIPSRQLQGLLPVPARYQSHVYHVLSVFVFFHLTVLAWIPFRAPDLATTLDMVTRALRFDGINPWMMQGEMLGLVAGLFGLHIVERWVSEYPPIRAWARPLAPNVVHGAGLAAIVLLIMLSSGNEQPFLYFRF